MTELIVLNIVEQKMQAVTLDGARVRTLVDGLDQTPDGVVVDHVHGHIYWTNMGTPDPGPLTGSEPGFFCRNGSIERVDLDGGNRQTVIASGGFTTGKQMAADFPAGKLYWCDREGMQVLRCNLDGSEIEPLIITGVGDDAAHDARNHPVGIAVDSHRRQLYWTQKGAPKAGQGRIFRAGLDVPKGSSAADRDDIELLWDNLPEPIDLHLDAVGTLVWTDRGNPPDGNTLNRASVAAALGKPEVCSRGYNEAIGLATADGATYYVGDMYGGSIRKVDFTEQTDCPLVNLGPGLTGMAIIETS